MADAKKYWNHFFEEKPFSNGKSPDEFLAKMTSRLQKGKVLDLAMGEGINSVYLAKEGFDVEGFDISDVAIERALKLALDSNVKIQTQCSDLDLFLMKLMHFDSIVMVNFKPQLSRFYSEMIRGLKQGGTLLISSSGIDEMKEAIPKDESFRDHYFYSNEILKNLGGLKILFYQEGEVDGKHVVQCLAQKPYDKDALKYNLFDMHSKQDGEPKKSKHLELAEQLFKK